jgi:hypothetical protein
MRGGCIAQGIVGLGSFEMLGDASSRAWLKSGAAKTMRKSDLRRAEIFALPRARPLTPGFWILDSGSSP